MLQGPFGFPPGREKILQCSERAAGGKIVLTAGAVGLVSMLDLGRRGPGGRLAENRAPAPRFRGGAASGGRPRNLHQDIPVRVFLENSSHVEREFPLAAGARCPCPQRTLGPVADLEAHLPEEWWRRLFNALYIKTDGDVVENTENTRREVDFLLKAADVTTRRAASSICAGGQGAPFAGAGAPGLSPCHRPRPLALPRPAGQEACRPPRGLSATFREGRCPQPAAHRRQLRLHHHPRQFLRAIFSSQDDDAKVLKSAGKLLKPSGTLYLDLSDGDWIKTHYEPRSWEWIDAHPLRLPRALAVLRRQPADLARGHRP